MNTKGEYLLDRIVWKSEQKILYLLCMGGGGEGEGVIWNLSQRAVPSQVVGENRGTLLNPSVAKWAKPFLQDTSQLLSSWYTEA